MIICLNPQSAGGKGAERWAIAHALLHRRGIRGTVISTRNYEELRKVVREAHGHGEHHFVAAGGDGSVNALLNALMNVVPEAIRSEVALGAIGLGSSNDFHKPYNPEGMIDKFPIRIDFEGSTPRDVGVLCFNENGTMTTRYFLINASIGLTAVANHLFNVPDRLLQALKRTNTGLAIAYAALRTIVLYKDLNVTVQESEGAKRDVHLTNLNILKSPHVSGSLTYPVKSNYEGELFNCYLAWMMGIADRLRLLTSLTHGRIPPSNKLEHWTCPGLAISSSTPFAVEFDGEVITTTEARFSLLPRHLRVCQC